MNKIERILFEQLQRHSSNYIESADRGIVCDDLDVDGFIEETPKLLQASYAEFFQRWTPVEEELPELDLHVFVVCEYSNGRKDYDALKRIASKDSARGWQWSSISHNSFFALKVTHWRPIERR